MMWEIGLHFKQHRHRAREFIKLLGRHFHKEEGLGNENAFNFQEIVEIPKTSVKFHPIWLRHHCMCEKCFNRKTFQKNLVPSELPSKSRISDITTTSSDIKVIWNDSHESQFNLRWLQLNYEKIQLNPPPIEIPEPKYVAHKEFNSKCKGDEFLSSSSHNHNPMNNSINHEKFMEDPQGLKELLTNIIRFGYGIIKDAPVDFNLTKKVVQRISHPQNTIYGDFSEWTSDLEHKDTAYTTEFVHLHTDTSYFSEPMGLQMFHCLKHDGAGGINLISDGFKAAERFQIRHPSKYSTLRRLNVPFHYLDPAKHHFYNVDTILNHCNTTGQLRRVRYNPHDMAVVNTIQLEDIGNFYESLVGFSEEIEKSPSWIKLTPGVVIFLDNWRVLHGRSEYTGFRHLCGAYISRSDWLSRARVMGIVKDLQ